MVIDAQPLIYQVDFIPHPNGALWLHLERVGRRVLRKVNGLVDFQNIPIQYLGVLCLTPMRNQRYRVPVENHLISETARKVQQHRSDRPGGLAGIGDLPG